MRLLFYNIFLVSYKTGIRIAAFFNNNKAKKWVLGRKDIFKKLREAIPANEKIIWVHCASLGEFEQGRPVMESLKKFNTGHRILLTFFSPSGYEVQKNYAGADWVFYLPMDGAANAKKFLEIVHPSLVIFVKYEFWYYYLKKIKYRDIHFLLISAQLKKKSFSQQLYGPLFKKMLSRFDHLFMQNPESKERIDAMGLAAISSISGDTRVDRVIEIAEKFDPIPLIEKFIGDSKVIVAGSTWPEDELVLQKAFSLLNDPSVKLIIAPHEIGENHLADIKKLFPGALRFSQLTLSSSPASSCLVIDNFGMLSKLYKYGHITYVGGALASSGVHNVLEAAVYSKPVLFGPVYTSYSEAVGLVRSGGGISFFDEKKDGIMLSQLFEALLNNKEEYELRSKAAGDFVRANKGATQKIIQFIQEKRLLTS